MAKLVVVAPHSDDECLGAGGTIARFTRSGGAVTVVTICSELEPQFEAGVQAVAQAEARHAHELLGVGESIFFNYPTTAVNEVPVAELNGRMQRVMDEQRPDIVLLPFPDRHIDHRVAFESAVVATRPYRQGQNIKLTAMYETISETFWNVPGAEPTFSPHWTVDITDSVQTKLEAFDLMASRHVPFPGPRSRQALLGLAQLRGSQASCGYGEAFQLIRMSIAPPDLVRILG